VPSTKFKKRDLNRFRKIYPYIRRSPRYVYTSDKEAVIEVGEVPFSAASSGEYRFTESFSSIPMITAISYDSESNDTADVNVFISSLSTTSVTFETSQAFTGKIHFHAVWVASE
jgi:hypothetical protein